MPNHEVHGWKLLLQSLLNLSEEEIKSLELTIDDQNKKISIATDNSQLAARLHFVLQSPSTIYKNLRYTLSRPNTDSTLQTPVETYPPMPPIGNLLKPGVIKHIFDPNLTSATGVQWTDKVNQQENYIIYFPMNLKLADVTKAQVEVYKNCLANATLTELRRALTLDSNHAPLTLSLLDRNMPPNGVLAKHIDKIFYTTQNDVAETIVCFDVRLLCYCVAPPTILQAPIIDEKFVIEIDKMHFIAYLATGVQEGFLLNIAADGKSAIPICFSIDRAIAQENIISFVLDQSGSMSEVFKDYIQEVCGFLKEIKIQSEQGTDFQNTTIRLRPFNGVSSVNEKSLNNGSDFNDMLSYLSNLSADGSTNLNNTIADEINDLNNQIGEKNITVVVFTDGEDTDGKEQGLARLQKIKEQLAQLTESVKIFTFGLGSHYNQNALEHLASISGSDHIHLDDIKKFKQGLNQHLDLYCKVVQLFRFVQKTIDANGEEIKQITDKRNIELNVKIQPGQVGASMGTGALQLPGSFTVNGVSYAVQTSTPTLSATTATKLFTSNTGLVSRSPIALDKKYKPGTIPADQSSQTVVQAYKN